MNNPLYKHCLENKTAVSSTQTYGALKPLRGIDSLVSDIRSDIDDINTEKARMTVTPIAIFSPAQEVLTCAFMFSLSVVVPCAYV